MRGFVKWIIALVAIIIVVFVFLFFRSGSGEPIIDNNLVVTKGEPEREVIGHSVEGRNIEAYKFGGGGKLVVFVGGIHGGYEWNSITLAQKVMEYLRTNPDIIPDGVSVAIIPNANPDGLEIGRGPEGRFNASKVDLNRNFDYKWRPEAVWKGNKVSAGTSPFSEPEARAIRNYALKYKPEAVIFWHSQANAVYASECEDGILPETLEIMSAYSKASGYPSIDSFDSYEVTGDAEGWLASIGIPAITVELKTHETIEWESNLAGAKAILGYYAVGRGAK